MNIDNCELIIMQIGIISYGFYIPRNRITVDEIAQTWGKAPEEIKKSLRVVEKAVASADEDAVTMAYESAAQTLADLDIDRKQIGAVFFGSETSPYAVKPVSTIIADWLGIENNYLAYDTQFACKAATGALISACALVKSEYTPYVLVCAADKANAKPHDVLEYTAGSGSVSLLVGSQDVILEIAGYTSFSSDTPDFWRKAGESNPSHAGRFTGKPSYFRHIAGAATDLLHKTGYKPADFQLAVFHMPNGRFPIEAAASLGFTPAQLTPSLVVSDVGNAYTASALMGLVAALEEAKAGDLIFFASYGSGAGSDAFVFRATPLLKERVRHLRKQIEHKQYLSYTQYLRQIGSILNTQS